jgi:hypothetical protein
MTELLHVPHTMTLVWRYGTSRYFAEFMQALREKRILGLRCPACRRVYLPPRPVCGNCHVELREWVEVKDTGTVAAFTTVHLPILDPATGQPRPTPYGMALIRLDGADTTLNHFLSESDIARLHIGTRVQAVWREEPQGRMSDIRFFEILRERQPTDDRRPPTASGRAPLFDEAAVSGPPSVVVEEGVSLSFRYAAGEAASRFLAALRDEKKIYGTRCPTCGRVLVPARSFCPRCYVDTTEWIEVGPMGTLVAVAAAPPPLLALIHLDGADTNFLHLLAETPPDLLTVGMRVEPVFAEQRIGSVLDITHFRAKPEEESQ